jgi:hypothetical protein
MVNAGGVVERLLGHVRAVLEHDRQDGIRRPLGGLLHEVVADDHERRAGRADVLLRAGVDQPVLRHVQRPAEHV